MKKILILIPLLLICLSLKADIFTDTNSFYNKGEMNIELAPTISFSSPSKFNGNKSHKTFGYSLETEYWTSENTGTGIETGIYDTTYGSQVGGIDHISVMEDIRIIPFKHTRVLNRFALELKLEAEQFILDGSKDIGFGPGLDWQITQHTRLQGNILQHYRTNPAEDGSTFRVGVIYEF